MLCRMLKPSHPILKAASSVHSSVCPCVGHDFCQAVIKQATMDGFWILRYLKKCFDLPVKMVPFKVASLACMVVKNGTEKKLSKPKITKNDISQPFEEL